MTRRYTIELRPVIGPEEDIPAPDMATNEKTMAWIMDTYSMVEGYAVPEIVTGKPVSIGGSVFRREATGAGVGVVVVSEPANGSRAGRSRSSVASSRATATSAGGGARAGRSRRLGDGCLGHLRRDLPEAGSDLAAVDTWVEEQDFVGRLPRRPARLELRSPSSPVRHPRPRRAFEDQVTADNVGMDRREDGRGVVRTGRRRSRRTRSSPSAASSSCWTSSTMPAA